MKKYENFCAALTNLRAVFDYEEPYNNVVLTGMVALYEICFEQSWKAVKEILENNKAERHLRGGLATKRKYAEASLRHTESI